MSQQNRGRLEDAWCLTRKAGKERQGLAGVPENGDKRIVKQRAGANDGGLVLGVSVVSLYC